MRLILLIALLLWALPALAQQCNLRTVIVGALAKNFQEVVTWNGFSGDKTIEIFTSAGGGTWSLVVTNPNRTSCLITHGGSWRDLKRAPVGTETRKSE